MLQKVHDMFSHPKIGFVLILFYVVIGLFIAGDYGSFTDEEMEWNTGDVNYKYIMGFFMDFSKSNDDVKIFMAGVPELKDWVDRYYGAALQFPLILIEHINDFKIPPYQVILMRHNYNFLNYALGALCFFIILRKRYTDSPIAFFGTLMYILYPRFFAEAFYNNKDILFFSWYSISVLFALNYLEKPNWIRMLLFAAIAAICTNVRILGISIVALVIVYILFYIYKERKSVKQVFLTCIPLLFCYFIFYVIITPVTWENPIKAITDIFFYFLHYKGWDGAHFYLGEMIGKDVPWHYIPVWMGVSVPIIYQILFVVGSITVAAAIMNKKTTRNEKMYDSFFMLLFFLSLFGFIGLRIHMYEGWRHVYFIFCPFLYLAARGIHQIYSVARKYSSSSKLQIASVLFYGFFSAYMIILGSWIVQNHPYQYVYFNRIARPYAEENFTLDYWHVATADIVREMLRLEKRPQIVVGFSSMFAVQSLLILTPEERYRILVKDKPHYHYFIFSSREYNGRINIEGYQKVFNITVDGCEIGSLFRRVSQEPL